LYQRINSLHTVIPKTLFPGGYAFPPMRVGCVLTHRCNLRCAMCFVWKHGDDRELPKKELSTSEWKSVFDQVPSQAIITMTGGEPLVRADFRELLMHACARHRVHLVSNGTLFSDDLVQLCVDLAPRSLFRKGLLSLGVSLEGPEPVHDAMVRVPGSYSRTTDLLKKIAHAKKEQRVKYPLLDLKIVICRDTLNSLIDLYDLADDLNLDIISFQQCSTQESSYGIDNAPQNAIFKAPPDVEPISRDELIPVLENLVARSRKGRTVLRFNPDMNFERFGDRYENRFPLEQFMCSAAWSVMHIGPYGTVFPCFSIPMGNIRDMPLKRIWNGETYKDFRKRLRKAGIFPGCTGCCVMTPRPDGATKK
jgi:MoaA/NifB/PqqE/SkfB family radical SAM enzyme